MAFLKDVRLLLIVGLAIVCLLALRLCSSEYQPNTVGAITNADNAVAGNTDNNTVSQSALQDVEESAAEVATEQAESGSEDDADESTEGVDATEVEPKEQEEEQQQDAESQDEAEAAVANAEASQITDQQQTAIVDEAPANDAQQETEAESKTITTDAAEVKTTEAVIEKYEIVPSTIAPYAAPESEKITLPAPSDSGEIILDLKTDLGVVKDGLQKYGERLDGVSTMIDKIKNPQ